MTRRAKQSTIEESISQIEDGATVMIGGFGVPGTPFELIKELVRQGQRNLTVIKNDANEAGMGVDDLLVNGQVQRLIVTHIGLNPNAMHMMHEGGLQVEFLPQGILAERVRSGGAGLLGIVTDVGIGTEINEAKQIVDVGGVRGVIEPALRADFALIHAADADTFGNLRFAGTARNFNPLMAMAAGCTIVETERISALGTVAPEDVHLPGVFVDYIVELGDLSEAYDVVQR
jgi:acetate CoA/acetoacetate CoA-transferase alpha subunit